MRHNTLGWLATALLVMLCAVAPLATRTAQAAPPPAVAPLADHVPADTAAYWGWAGTDNLKAAYSKSALKGVVDQSTLPNWIEDKITEAIAGQQMDEKTNAQDARDIIEMILKYPHAAAFLGLETVAGKEPLPQAVIMVDAGPDGAALLAKLNSHLDKNKPAPTGVPVTARMAGTLVVLEMGNLTPAQKAAIDGKAPATLASLPAFASAEKVNDPAFILYADAPRILALIEEGMTAPTVPANGKEMARKIIDALGVRDMKQMVYSGGFDGTGWNEKTEIEMGQPRSGVLALLSPKPLAEAALKAVPKDALMMTVNRLDLTATLALARKVVGAADANALKQMEQGLAQAKEQMGVDLEKGLINALGDTLVLYRMPAGATGGMIAAIPLKDGKALASTFSALKVKLADMAPMIEVTEEQADGATKWSIKMPNREVGVAVKGDWLVIGAPAALDSALAQLDAKTSILDNPTFVALRQTFGARPITAIGYGDLKTIYAEAANAVQTLAQLMPSLKLPEGGIPKAQAIEKYLTPGMDITWVDEKGLHVESKTAFPLAGMITGQQTMSPAVAAFGVAILLPSLGRARELANRTAEAANESGMLKAALVWSNENDDKLPEHLAQLVADGSISPKALVTKRSGTAPLVLTDEQKKAAEKDWHTIEKLVDEHCDYVYLGKGLKATFDSSFILIYTKPSLNLTGGINVGYGDAHVEFHLMTGLAELFKTYNSSRKQLKIPELKLDDKGMPPSSAP